MNKCLLTAVVAGVGLLANAEIFYLTKAPSTLADWKNAEFYEGDTAPTGAATDSIYTVKDNALAITVDGSDSELMSFLSGIAEVCPLDASFTVNVPENQTVSLGCAVWDRSKRTGKLIKTGKGQLNLTAFRKNGTTGTSISDYETVIDVQEGTLQLIQADSGLPAGSPTLYIVFHTVNVAEGATLITPPYQTWQTRGIEGLGMITNAASTTVNVYVYSYSDKKHIVFGGAMGGNMYVEVRNTILDITSANVSISGGIVGYNYQPDEMTPEVWAHSFGKATDLATSIGSANNAEKISLKAGAPLVYTGLGEDCDRPWQINYMNSIISGGTNGNLTLSGEFHKWTATKHNIGIVLDGDNLWPCTFASKVEEFHREVGGVKNVLCNYYLTKRGTGEWKMPTTAKFLNSGVIAVENGTLSYGSIDRMGELTALGTSSNTYACVETPSEAARTDYAFLLGTADSSNCGYLECTAARAQQCTDRPFAIAGIGGFKANTALVKLAKVYGVGDTGSAKTLVLDGALTTASEVHDVSDYASDADSDSRPTLSVRKEGAGTWVLGGNQTFSGALTVNGGKLIVRRAPQQYKRYRLMVMETASKNSDYGMVDARTDVHISEIGLYAANGERQNLNLKYNTAYAALEPGQCALGYNRTISTLTNGVYNVFELLFDGYRKRFNDEEQKTASWHALQNSCFYFENDQVVQPSPVYAQPKTHLPIDMYLEDIALPIDHFDVLITSPNDNRVPSRFQLLASVDGVHWDAVSDVAQISQVPSSYPLWLSNMKGGDYVDGGTPSSIVTSQSHTSGWSITKPSPTTVYSLLANVGEVSVASGATLEYDGEDSQPTLNKLKVNAAGAGTLKGFALASSGTIDVETASNDISVPLKLESMTLPDSFDNWQVKVNGVVKPYKLVKTSGNQLAIERPGMVLIFR